MIPEYSFFAERFRNYVQSVGIHDEFVQEHLDLKSEHTFRVADNIAEIADISGLPHNERVIAKLIALVHDIGRFEQFIRYRTFDDRESVNHAFLGVEILKRTGFLKELDDESIHLIYHAVMNHNVSALDTSLDPKILHFTRLIRDADKLDIWYILTLRDVVNKILQDIQPEESYNVPGYIMNAYRNGKTVPSAKSMNDYRLLRLSWIYDMNFPATFALAIKRGYTEKILAKIPPSGEKDEIAAIIRRYVEEKAGMLLMNLLKF